VQSPQTAARGDEHKLRVHTGLVDQSALSSKPPKEVMSEVLKVLLEMGMEVKRENEYRLRCTRVRRKKAGATTSLGLGSVMSVGSGMSPFALMNNASTSRVSVRSCNHTIHGATSLGEEKTIKFVRS
jgi:protein-serine/threonine kinase